MLLGWIAGTMAVTDPALVNPDVVPQMPKIVASDLLRYGAGVAGALLVLALGKWLAHAGAPAAAPRGRAARTRAGAMPARAAGRGRLGRRGSAPCGTCWRCARTCAIPPPWRCTAQRAAPGLG